MKTLIFFALMLSTSISFASQRCTYQIMMKLDLPVALADQPGVTPGERRTAIGGDFTYIVDHTPALEAQGRNRWRVQVYEQETNQIVLNSGSFVSSDEAIEFNSRIVLPKQQGKCPSIEVRAQEQGYLWATNTVLFSNVDSTEAFGQDLYIADSLSDYGVDSWRNHKAGINAIVSVVDGVKTGVEREDEKDFFHSLYYEFFNLVN